MSDRSPNRPRPDRAVFIRVLELAVRAPSIHNTQPWLWRVEEDELELYADASRQLRVVDPGRRALHVSCGAALDHAALALRAAGWTHSIRRMPNPFQADHLATVLVTGRAEPEPEVRTLVAAAQRRRTDRRPFAERPLSPQDAAALSQAAVAAGAFLHPVTRNDDRLILAVAIGRADEIESSDPDYRAETSRWTGERPGALDGVPLDSIPDLAQRQAQMQLRDLHDGGTARLQVPRPRRTERDSMFVLATERSGPVAQIRAGEALSRVLLTATDMGLAVSPYTQPLEVAGPRSLLHRVLGGFGEPQIVLRVGWPGPGDEPPPTPRRPLSEIVLTGTGPEPPNSW